MLNEDVADAKFEAEQRRQTLRLTLTYVFALSLLAFLSASTYFSLALTIDEQKDAATIVNVAGRQRMLSQQTALLAEDLKAGDATARQPLIEAVNRMEREHNALLIRDDLGLSSPLSPKADAYYRSGEPSLDVIVRKYIADARAFIAAEPGDDRQRLYESLHEAARHDLLPRLNEAVLIFETEANDRVSRLLWTQRGIQIMFLIALMGEGLLIFRPMMKRISNHARSLYREYAVDSLTGLPNRRQFFEVASRQRLLSNRTGQPFSVLFIDLDHFKTINDSWGHSTGDKILARFGELLQGSLRKSDIYGRIGGEEFAVLLPNTPMTGAFKVAEKIRQIVEDERGEWFPPFTVSIGVTGTDANDISLDDLLRRSDAALYFAKQSGRNTVAFQSTDDAPAELVNRAVFHRPANPPAALPNLRSRRLALVE